MEGVDLHFSLLLYRTVENSMMDVTPVCLEAVNRLRILNDLSTGSGP